MARNPRRVPGAVLGPTLVLAVSVLCVSGLAVAPAAGAQALDTVAGHAVATTAQLTSCVSAGSQRSSRHGRLLGIVAPETRHSGTCGAPSTGGATTSGTVLTPNLRTSSTPATTTTPERAPAATPTATSAKAYSGSPPLLYHGGPVMGAPGAPGDVTVTPIFWDPGNTMAPSYKSVIDGYLSNVAADDGALTNVFSADDQYGTRYAVHAGTPVGASDAITDGCSPDSGSVYSDNSGYIQCVTDAQIQAEVDTVLSTHSLPSGLAHSYAVFLPKGVESCQDARDNAQGGQCTVSAQGGAFCAYHANTASDAIYSDIPFPIYSSLTGFTCGSENAFGTNESPNAQRDADVVLSPLSHELSEAITDPLGNAWFDGRGNEIADDCAGFYGPTHGVAGALYNQTVNGAHYLTQELFSNEDYRVSKNSACIQHADLPAASFKVATRSPRARHPVHFTAAKSKGNIAAYSWSFGDASPAGSGKRPSHTYGAPGSYFVTLTVTDVDAVTNATTVLISVS